MLDIIFLFQVFSPAAFAYWENYMRVVDKGGILTENHEENTSRTVLNANAHHLLRKQPGYESCL